MFRCSNTHITSLLNTFRAFPSPMPTLVPALQESHGEASAAKQGAADSGGVGHAIPLVQRGAALADSPAEGHRDRGGLAGELAPRMPRRLRLATTIGGFSGERGAGPGAGSRRESCGGSGLRPRHLSSHLMSCAAQRADGPSLQHGGGVLSVGFGGLGPLRGTRTMRVSQWRSVGLGE